MLEKAGEILKKYVGGGDLVGIAVSGGSDSMCLLDFVIRSGAAVKKNILIINFDHGIRGAESESDSRFVAAYAKSNGVRIYHKKTDIPALSAKSGRSLETEARLFRKTEFERLSAEEGLKYILVAHNLGDRTESVLMHIFRGCGLKGLVGPSELDGNILRPLIYTPKSEILGYLEKNNVKYVEDKTNLSSDYTRNYLRNEVLPLIRQRWSVDEALLGLSSISADALGRLGENAADVRTDGGSALISLLELSPESVCAGAAALGVYTDITKKHISAVLGLKNKQTGAGVDIAHRLRAVREYDAVRMHRKAESYLPAAPFALGSTALGDCTVNITECESVVIPGRLRFDTGKLPPGAELRFKRAGDRFTPCGGKGRLLSDYLTDKKIPAYKRGGLPLIAAGSEVLAVCGVEISDRIKLDGDTRSAAEITVTAGGDK